MITTYTCAAAHSNTAPPETLTVRQDGADTEFEIDPGGRNSIASIILSGEDTLDLRDQLNRIVGNQGKADDAVVWVKESPGTTKGPVGMDPDEAYEVLQHLTERAGGVLSDREKTTLRWAKGNIKRMQSEPEAGRPITARRTELIEDLGAVRNERDSYKTLSDLRLRVMLRYRDETVELREQLEQEKEQHRADTEAANEELTRLRALVESQSEEIGKAYRAGKSFMARRVSETTDRWSDS